MGRIGEVVDPEIQRCIAEQRRAAREYRAGDRGARLGVSDWLMEEAILRAEGRR